jgi:hypothetical protein
MPSTPAYTSSTCSKKYAVCREAFYCKSAQSEARTLGMTPTTSIKEKAAETVLAY